MKFFMAEIEEKKDNREDVVENNSVLYVGRGRGVLDVVVNEQTSNIDVNKFKLFYLQF